MRVVTVTTLIGSYIRTGIIAKAWNLAAHHYTSRSNHLRVCIRCRDVHTVVHYGGNTSVCKVSMVSLPAYS
jgi:hypothetical protein